MLDQVLAGLKLSNNQNPMDQYKDHRSMNRFSAFVIVAIFSAMPFVIEWLAFSEGSAICKVIAGMLIILYGCLFLSVTGAIWRLSHTEGGGYQ